MKTVLPVLALAFAFSTSAVEAQIEPVFADWFPDVPASWSDSDSLQGMRSIVEEGAAVINQASYPFDYRNHPANPGAVAVETLTDGDSNTGVRGVHGENNYNYEEGVMYFVFDLAELDTVDGSGNHLQLERFAQWMRADQVGGGVLGEFQAVQVSRDRVDWVTIGVTTDHQGTTGKLNKLEWAWPAGSVVGFRYLRVQDSLYPLDFGPKHPFWVEWDAHVRILSPEELRQIR